MTNEVHDSRQGNAPTENEETAATECPLRRIHREWKAYCESLGYDVDANRAAVGEALIAKDNKARRART